MPIPARGRRRSCWRRRLTPPLRQHRPAFTGLRMVSHGWPFADSARDSDVAGFRMVVGLLHAFRLADDLARCPASKPRHFVPRLGNVGHTSGSVTEGRETSSGQGSAITTRGVACRRSQAIDGWLPTVGVSLLAALERLGGGFLCRQLRFQVRLFPLFPQSINRLVTVSSNSTSQPQDRGAL